MKYAFDHELGCGLIGGIFGRRLRKTSSSVRSLPSNNITDDSNTQIQEHPKNPPARRRRSLSMDVSTLVKSSAKHEQKSTRKPELLLLPPRNLHSHQKTSHPTRPSDATRSSTSSSNSSSCPKREPQNQELSNEKPKWNHSKDLFRATSSNAMVRSQLGNLRQLGNLSPKVTNGKLQEVNLNFKPKSVIMGNVVRQPRRLDDEELKNMGNEAYKQGRLEEALRLYERAISLNSRKAIYWCNKSAALVGLGRLIEASDDCKEAIRLDPQYLRAHHRLATIFLRLGEAEQALYHYRCSGPHANAKELSQAQALGECIGRCNAARKITEWDVLIKETQSAVESGADSAPKVFALQAEAFLRLNRHQEADTAYKKVPNFPIESCISFFGLHVSAYLLKIRAEVCMVYGRLEDAVAAAQQAASVDPGNKEVSLVFRRARLVSSARLSGNLLFKACKFSEASLVYTEGLEHDPFNPILLCNRAACRSKLGQFEKAIEDCTAALNVQPSYRKARLRRADCYAKLERWESAIQDYETMKRECLEDEEVARALLEAQLQLKQQRGEDMKMMKLVENKCARDISM